MNKLQEIKAIASDAIKAQLETLSHIRDVKKDLKASIADNKKAFNKIIRDHESLKDNQEILTHKIVFNSENILHSLDTLEDRTLNLTKKYDQLYDEVRKTRQMLYLITFALVCAMLAIAIYACIQNGVF